jgi:O-methyltransferase
MRLIGVFKNHLKKVFYSAGFGVVNSKQIYPPDIAVETEFIQIYEKCKLYTMTSLERMFSLYKAVEYVVKNKIPGDLVECGVWRGGSSMLMALTLIKMEEEKRKIYLYDTYSGMTEPGEFDIRFDGQAAKKEWLANVGKDKNRWCYASIDEVKMNLLSVGYPEEKLIFVQGDIRKSLPKVMPQEIAILRLDTDWYELTYHELCHLFPRLLTRGVIIVDDYGFWKGARKAVERYFKENNINILLGRVDYTGRIGVR